MNNGGIAVGDGVLFFSNEEWMEERNCFKREGTIEVRGRA